jgi:hypothetical protein
MTMVLQLQWWVNGFTMTLVRQWSYNDNVEALVILTMTMISVSTPLLHFQHLEGYPTDEF